MFIGAEIRLDVCFTAARARLANLASGGLLRRASDDAYNEWHESLARVGPLGAAPGLSRLVTVQFRDTASREDTAAWALRWQAAGTAGALFPVLDADITLTPAGDDATVLTVRGAYRPPLGGLGAGLDQAIMHRVAEATIAAFTRQVGTAIAHPVATPAAGQARILPHPPARPEPETP